MGGIKKNMDIVPELQKSIEKAFEIHTKNDRILSRVTKRIRDGTATQEDAHTYSIRIGRNSSRALLDVLTEENLPDGKLYYNIATRTVIPTLANNQVLVNDVSAKVQKAIDEKSKINLNSIIPEFPSERINGLIDKMTADDITLDDARVWIDEPIVNNTEAFYDDFIRENADFRYGAGLKTTITRTAEYNCCDWCSALEGTYEYGEEPEDIYRRHEFCRCTVTFQSEKTSQNVWSKKTWESTPEELERRENTNIRLKTKYEREQTLERLEKDRQIKRIMDATGYTRDTARELAKKSDEEIEEAIKTARQFRRR